MPTYTSFNIRHISSSQKIELLSIRSVFYSPIFEFESLKEIEYAKVKLSKSVWLSMKWSQVEPNDMKYKLHCHLLLDHGVI